LQLRCAQAAPAGPLGARSGRCHSAKQTDALLRTLAAPAQPAAALRGRAGASHSCRAGGCCPLRRCVARRRGSQPSLASVMAAPEEHPSLSAALETLLLLQTCPPAALEEAQGYLDELLALLDACADDDDEALARQLSTAAAFATIVAAMRSHAADWVVQELACRALDRLLESHDNDAQTMALAAGAMKAAAAALTAHAAHGSLAVFACHAVDSCAYDNDCELTGRYVCSAGAPAAVVAALRLHEADADVAGAACDVLVSLVRASSDAKHAAVAAGTLEAVVGACRAHPADAFVQRHGCDAIGSMCTASPRKVKQRAFNAGAVEVALAALVAHSHDEHVAAEACGVLYRVTPIPSSNAPDPVAAVAIKAVLKALAANPASTVVNEHGWAALHHFCVNDNTTTAAPPWPSPSAASSWRWQRFAAMLSKTTSVEHAAWRSLRWLQTTMQLPGAPSGWARWSCAQQSLRLTTRNQSYGLRNFAAA
jgi:hypothetical protein